MLSKNKIKNIFLCLPIQQQPCIFLWTDYLMTCIGLYSIQCIDLYWPVSTFITGHCLDMHLGSNIVISAEHTSFFFEIRWEIYLSSMYSNHVFEFNVFWACCQRSSFNKSDSQPVDKSEKCCSSIYPINLIWCNFPTLPTPKPPTPTPCSHAI